MYQTRFYDEREGRSSLIEVYYFDTFQNALAFAIAPDNSTDVVLAGFPETEDGGLGESRISCTAFKVSEDEMRNADGFDIYFDGGLRAYVEEIQSEDKIYFGS